MKFLEPNWKPKVIHIDNSLEFGKSCEDLSWNHCTSPHRSETCAIAERAVRRNGEGTSAVLLQSGLSETDSMECCCYLRNIQDLLSDGKTPNDRRFRNTTLTVQLSRLEQWSKITLFLIKTCRDCIKFGYIPWICRCTRRESGKETSWSQTLCVVEQMDASELHARRLNAKEVLTPMKGGNFIFPIADGTVKLHGRDQVLRTPTLIRDRPDRGEEQGNLLGESDGSSSTPLRGSPWFDGEARNDFWSISNVRKHSCCER